MKPTPEEKEALKAALLASGKSEAPPPGAREQGLARLLEAEAKVPPSPLARAARITGGLVVVGVVLALLARGGSTASVASADAGSAVLLVVDAGQATTTLPAAVPDAGTQLAEPQPDVVDAGVALSAPADAGQRSTGRLAPREVDDADDLARELALLDEARKQLTVTPAEALATLDVHARSFPRGALRTEAALLRVQALLALGRRAEAGQIARALRATERDGLVSKRLDRLLDAGTP